MKTFFAQSDSKIVSGTTSPAHLPIAPTGKYFCTPSRPHAKISALTVLVAAFSFASGCASIKNPQAETFEYRTTNGEVVGGKMSWPTRSKAIDEKELNKAKKSP